MKNTLLIATAFSILTSTAFGCEPVLPLLQVYSGTIFFAGSAIILLSAVLLKCIAFAFLEKSLDWKDAIGLMFIANIFSTLIGLFLSVGAAMPSVFIGAIIIVFGVSYMPACRLVEKVPWAFLKQFNGAGLAFTIVGLYIATYFLFAWSQQLLNSESPTWLYWLAKVGFIYAAIIISIMLTTVWEEYIIARYMSKTVANADYFLPALKANLITMLAIMAYAAAMMIPKRLESPQFLAYLQNMFG